MRSASGYHCPVLGIDFHGSDATLTVNPGGFEVVTERGRQIAGAGSEKVSGDQLVSHTGNFLECVKSRGVPVCDIEIGHRSTSTCLLGNIARRMYGPKPRIKIDLVPARAEHFARARRGYG